MNKKVLEEYSVKIYEFDSFFYEHHTKKKLTKMAGNTYYLEMMSILLKIFWPQKLINKTMKVETLFLKRKDRRHQKQKLGYKFIRINTSDAGRDYDTDYEVSKIQTFISKCKERQLKELEKE